MNNSCSLISTGKSNFIANNDFNNLVNQTEKIFLELNHGFNATIEDNLKRDIMIQSTLYVHTASDQNRKPLVQQQQEFEFMNLRNDIESYKCLEQAIYISLGDILKYIKIHANHIHKDGKLSLLDEAIVSKDITAVLSILF